MADLLKTFLSPFVVAYIVGVILIPVITSRITSWAEKRTARRRREVGLDDRILRNPKAQLQVARKQSQRETIVFLILALLLPVVLLMIIHFFPDSLWGFNVDKDGEKEKINLAFAALLVWTLVSGTSLAKNFIGGLAFRALSSASQSIQVGDRATLDGHHGIVQNIGIFHTTLQTLDDDLISIPTTKLLDSTLSSTNAGSRSSLCVMPFYLSAFSTSRQIQKAEDIIWETIQSSVYFDFGHPFKIFLKQQETCIILTAKVYVSSTYEEAEFSSSVTKKILRAFQEHEIDVSGPKRKAPMQSPAS